MPFRWSNVQSQKLSPKTQDPQTYHTFGVDLSCIFRCLQQIPSCIDLILALTICPSNLSWLRRRNWRKTLKISTFSWNSRRSVFPGVGIERGSRQQAGPKWDLQWPTQTLLILRDLSTDSRCLDHFKDSPWNNILDSRDFLLDLAHSRPQGENGCKSWSRAMSTATKRSEQWVYSMYSRSMDVNCNKAPKTWHIFCELRSARLRFARPDEIRTDQHNKDWCIKSATFALVWVPFATWILLQCYCWLRRFYVMI